MCLEQALGENDLNTLATLAHQLKGSGGGHGFPAITAAAKEMEAGARAHEDLSRLQQQFQELADLCRRASAESEAVKTP